MLARSGRFDPTADLYGLSFAFAEASPGCVRLAFSRRAGRPALLVTCKGCLLSSALVHLPPRHCPLPALVQVWLVAEGAVESPVDIIQLLGVDHDK